LPSVFRYGRPWRGPVRSRPRHGGLVPTPRSGDGESADQEMPSEVQTDAAAPVQTSLAFT
jgi:hypothetical protein